MAVAEEEIVARSFGGHGHPWLLASYTGLCEGGSLHMKSASRRMCRELEKDADGRSSVATNREWGTTQQLVSLGSHAIISFALIVVLAFSGINLMTAGLSGLAIKVLVAERWSSIIASILLIRKMTAMIICVVIGAVSVMTGSGTIVIATLLLSLILCFRLARRREQHGKFRLLLRDPTCMTPGDLHSRSACMM